MHMADGWGRLPPTELEWEELRAERDEYAATAMRYLAAVGHYKGALEWIKRLRPERHGLTEAWEIADDALALDNPSDS
jgi:hypothetical protein